MLARLERVTIDTCDSLQYLVESLAKYATSGKLKSIHLECPRPFTHEYTELRKLGPSLLSKIQHLNAMLPCEGYDMGSTQDQEHPPISHPILASMTGLRALRLTLLNLERTNYGGVIAVLEHPKQLRSLELTYESEEGKHIASERPQGMPPQLKGVTELTLSLPFTLKPHGEPTALLSRR